MNMGALGCSQSSGKRPLPPAKLLPGQVRFTGGHDTDRQDHGRPIALIGPALGVTPEMFRAAFSGVSPSRTGPPSPFRARANKKVLMDALGQHGVSNDRLDEVSNFYRYDPGSGELWNYTPAEAKAIVQDGKVTSIEISNAGAGYTSAPAVTIVGHESIKVRATIEFSTDLSRNGSVTSLTIVD